MRAVRENEVAGFNGIAFLLLGLGGLGGTVWAFVEGIRAQDGLMAGGAVLGGVLILFFLTGLVAVNPNEAVVLQLFGEYTGTIRQDGLRWVNPFYKTRRLSVRANSFESTKLKVNDLDGNPIEIAAIVVFRVMETAQACFAVENYVQFVYTQTEAALRNLASRHPYDAADDVHSLRRNTAEMAEQLKVELQTHIGAAGVIIVDAKISHLAYAQEIAHAMLQRQQASAIIAARQKIVEGAVGMVQMALHKLSEERIVELDEERKAQMVANLLVVLCSERSVQPVVNSGTIYP